MTPSGGSGAGVPSSFNQRLEQVCITRNSNLCVGLDPDKSRIAALLSRGADDVSTGDCLAAMQTAASASAPYAAAFKPNAAFFEALEEDTPLMAHMGQFLTNAFSEAIALCDAKRGDIGNTSAAYAHAIFQKQGFHCVTVNPLMGADAVGPFIADATRGVFLLCLTSNPGADDFLLKNDLYLRIAEKAVEWNTLDNVGLVVGATRPEYLGRIREIAPNLPLLIPGVGAQGGKLDETLDAIGAQSNRRFLINASRSVLYPAGATWEDYPTRVSAAARELCEQINAQLA